MIKHESKESENEDNKPLDSFLSQLLYLYIAPIVKMNFNKLYKLMFQYLYSIIDGDSWGIGLYFNGGHSKFYGESKTVFALFV